MNNLRVGYALLLSSVLWPLVSSAQVPELINYQGRIVSGTNLVNGTVALSLRLFTTPSGGSLIYEDSNAVTVVDGLYSTILGDTNTTPNHVSLSTVLTNETVYLETMVNGVALSPRERVISSAYALWARTAGGLVPPVSIVYSNYPDPVLYVVNNGGGPAIYAESTNASALAGINWGDGNALFAANAGSGPSAVFLGGNVGVGTQTPGEKLSVGGPIYSSAGGFKFPDGSVQESAATALWKENDAGNLYAADALVGIGTESPSNNLHLQSPFAQPVSIRFESVRQVSTVTPVFYTNTYTSATATNVSTNGFQSSFLGGPWTNLQNIFASDNVRAFSKVESSVVYAWGEYATRSLMITNIGISVPTNAANISVRAYVECYFSPGVGCNISVDMRSRTIFGNWVPPPNSGPNISTNETTYMIGMTTPVFITSLTNSSYGLQLDFVEDSGNCYPSPHSTVFIDSIRFEVSYFTPLSGTDTNDINYVMGIPYGHHHFVIVPGSIPANPSIAVTNDGGIVIATNGWVGIGTPDPAYVLHVDGSAGKPGGGSWSTASDERLKENIRPLSGTLQKLLALRGVTFEYKDPAAIHELSGERIGLVAQEVEKVFPDWVEVGPDGYKRLTVRGFEALAVEALRDLRAEKDKAIRDLSLENDALREKLDELARQQREMEARLESLSVAH